MRPPSRAVLVAAAVALLALASALPAHAQQFVRIDHCNLVIVNGQTCYHYSFTVINATSPNDVGEVVFIPVTNQAPGDTCHTLARVGPQYWTDLGNGGIGGGGWGWACGTHSGSQILGVIPPGGSQSGFEVTLSRAACCFEVSLGSPVLIGDETGGEFCFTCEGATASRNGTWGAIKSLYR